MILIFKAMINKASKIIWNKVIQLMEILIQIRMNFLPKKKKFYLNKILYIKEKINS